MNSVYKSVSKSIFPAVHHPLRVPAALLGGRAPGFNPPEPVTFKGGAGTLQLGVAVASNISWFSNNCVPVASVLKKFSMWAGANGTVKLKMAVPQASGWQVTNLQTLTVTTGLNEFSVAGGTLTQQNLPAGALVGIFSSTANVIRYIADTGYQIGWTYFNTDVSGNLADIAQGLTSELMLSYEAECTRGVDSEYIFNNSFAGVSLVPARCVLTTGDWTFNGTETVPSAKLKYFKHFLNSNCDKKVIEVDFQFTDITTRFCIITANKVGGGGSDQGGCIGIDSVTNSIVHYAATTDFTEPGVTTTHPIGFTLATNVNYRFSLIKNNKIITAKITNLDNPTETFEASKDNTSSIVSGLFHGQAGMFCSNLQAGFGVKVSAWRCYHNAESNPSVFVCGDSITEGSGGLNTNMYAQLLMDATGNQSWFDGDGGTNLISIYRRWNFTTNYMMPKYVVIQSVNAQNSDLEVTNYQTYIVEFMDRAIRYGSIPIVCYTPPSNEPAKQTRINTMNAFLTTELASRPTAIAARLDLAMSLGNDGVSWNVALFADGVHPNQAGHRVMADTIIAAAPAAFPVALP